MQATATNAQRSTAHFPRRLRLEGVRRVVRGQTHLDKINLTIEVGSLTVLLGPAQAGKTTLLRLMAGLDPPTAGQVLLGETQVQRIPARHRNVGFVHQEFVNYPGFTVYENVAAPLARARVARAEIDRRVREMAALLRLDSLLERRPSELSGGQQQRTALARALVRQGSLVLLDEPLVNLDFKLREELHAELRSLFARRDATLVYATADPGEALALGGTTVVLDEGRALQKGAALDVYRRPVSDRVAEITSDPPMNLAPGHVGSGRLRLGTCETPLPGHLRAIPSGRYRFGVRPHELSLSPRASGDLSLEAIIELAEIGGSETFLHVRVAGAGPRSWVIRETGVDPHEPGEAIPVFLDTARLYLFDETGALVAAPEA